jgi:gluconokinase
MPMILVVTGVSGSGKTTLGELLAKRLGCGFSDADQFHSTANKARMAAGIALTDSDRLPWLLAMRGAIEAHDAARENHVFACSALKHSYRRLLRANVAGLLFIFLHGPADVLAERLRRRRGHFFAPELLDDQLRTLEPPNADEALLLDIREPPEELVERVIQELAGRRQLPGE